MSRADELLNRYSLVSDQVDKRELRAIVSALEQQLELHVPGDVVELGCYLGTTSLFLQRLIQQMDPDKQLHVYDSFAGLPAKTAADRSTIGEAFTPGQLYARKADFIRNFKKAGLPLPVIHKAWFRDLQPVDMPAQIMFAFLDGDYYDSIKDSLVLVWPRLAQGAVLVVDDYQNEALPGVARAVDEWLQTHPAQLSVVSSLAVIKSTSYRA